jgi:hypothetical protein
MIHKYHPLLTTPVVHLCEVMSRSNLATKCDFSLYDSLWVVFSWVEFEAVFLVCPVFDMHVCGVRTLPEILGSTVLRLGGPVL